MPVGKFSGAKFKRNFASLSARTLVHSVAGCGFYGAFAAKVLLVHTRRLPGWALPLAGGLLLSAVVLAWLTSALWLFATVGVTR